jgi:hypothetical protein
VWLLASKQPSQRERDKARCFGSGLYFFVFFQRKRSIHPPRREEIKKNIFGRKHPLFVFILFEGLSGKWLLSVTLCFRGQFVGVVSLVIPLGCCHLPGHELMNLKASNLILRFCP